MHWIRCDKSDNFSFKHFTIVTMKWSQNPWKWYEQAWPIKYNFTPIF